MGPLIFSDSCKMKVFRNDFELKTGSPCFSHTWKPFDIPPFSHPEIRPGSVAHWGSECEGERRGGLKPTQKSLSCLANKWQTDDMTMAEG